MKSSSPLVSIITPAYRVEYFIEKFIRNISSIRYPNFEVIMIFDPSPDKSIQLAKQMIRNKKNWHLVVNKSHLGISKSLNLGIKMSKGKYITFFMTDMIIEPSCLDKLVNFIETTSDKSVGAAAAKILDFHKHDRIQTYRMYLLPQTGFLYIPEYGLKDSKKYDKPFVGFSGIDGTLFKREVFKKAGLFDTDIDLSINDLDMVWRIYLAGFTVVRIPTAKVYHWSLKIGRGDVKWEFTYAKMINLFIQNYSIKYLLIYLPQLIFVYTARSFITLLSGNADPIKGWIKAICWSFIYLPKALKKRKNVQGRIRTVSDEYLHSIIFGKLSLWNFYKYVKWVQKTITPIMLTEEGKDERILTYTK